MWLGFVGGSGPTHVRHWFLSSVMCCGAGWVVPACVAVSCRPAVLLWCLLGSKSHARPSLVLEDGGCRMGPMTELCYGSERFVFCMPGLKHKG
jgi:hypothetical protein